MKNTNTRKFLITFYSTTGIAMLIVGVLFKIMHWPMAGTMILTATSLLVLGTVISFFTNRNRTMLDWARLVLVMTFCSQFVVVIFHLPFANLLRWLFFAALAWFVTAWFVKDRSEQLKFLKENILFVLGALLVITGCVFKIMHYPNAGILLIAGMILCSLSWFISAFISK